MIKSNTNMEEIGELASPRPPVPPDYPCQDSTQMVLQPQEEEYFLISERTYTEILLDDLFQDSTQMVFQPLDDGVECEYYNTKDSHRRLRMENASLKQPIIVRICIWNEEETKIKFFILIELFALLHLLGIDDNFRHQANPERGKVTCINVYLLGNDGAHSYNGNGTHYSRQTNSNENQSLIAGADTYRREFSFLILPPRPPSRVLLQKPTDELIAVIAMKIGPEYGPLALCLGLSPSELYHIEEENRSAVNRNMVILLRWRDYIEKDATIERLANAFERLGINSDIVYNSLKDA